MTPAPPLDTSRRLATRSAEKPGADISETKNVGGPIMKVTRSRSIRSSACSGSQRAISTLVNGTTPGSVMPFNSPEMCASGAGMSTTSSTPSPCTLAMSTALYPSDRCVCSTPLGAPLDPDVKSTAASADGSDQCSSARAPLPEMSSGVERARERAQRNVVPRQLHGRLQPRDERRGLLAPERVMDRRRDRTEAPARAVHQRDRRVVGCLPADDVARLDATIAEPAGERCDRVGVVVAVVFAEQRVERRDVPRATGPRVLVRRGCA